MLKIFEHFEYYEDDHLAAFKQVVNWESYLDKNEPIDYIYYDAEKKQQCVSLKLSIIDGAPQCLITSSYYIGLDKFSKLGLPIYIQPKVNNELNHLNYIHMLFEALKEPQNFDHMQGLVKIEFEKEWIEIENELQPILTPFLIAEFLATVKDLVVRGLKKSYYTRVENLNSRIKGKVLVGRQVKENLLKNRVTKSICQYQEHGLDTEVNQFLKFVLNVIPYYLEGFDSKGQIMLHVEEIRRYCKPSFQHVSNKSFNKLTFRENNPFYKQYSLAIELGNQIIALKDYNISRNREQTKCKHPPFWIDMSKLFELYVFKHLKQTFKGDKEVTYHHKVYKQELDFIINTSDLKAVVDAKYKPRYARGNPSIEDARQLSGYTRLNKVYNEFDMHEDKIIPAYFIYPSNLQSVPEKLNKDNMENFEEVGGESMQLLSGAFRKSTMYNQMYLQEIDLPIHC